MFNFFAVDDPEYLDRQRAVVLLWGRP